MCVPISDGERVASPPDGRFRSCHNNKELDLHRCSSSANRLNCSATASVSHRWCLFRYISIVPFSVPSVPEPLRPLPLSPNLGLRFPSSTTDLHGCFVLEAADLFPRPFGACVFDPRLRPRLTPQAPGIDRQSLCICSGSFDPNSIGGFAGFRTRSNGRERRPSGGCCRPVRNQGPQRCFFTKATSGTIMDSSTSTSSGMSWNSCMRS